MRTPLFQFNGTNLTLAVVPNDEFVVFGGEEPNAGDLFVVKLVGLLAVQAALVILVLVGAGFAVNGFAGAVLVVVAGFGDGETCREQK